jgi:hypothetical protein
MIRFFRRDSPEGQRHLPDPVAAASWLLQRLPDSGIDLESGRYRVAPVAWEVSVPEVFGHGEPTRCTVPARMLLRDAVVLDLRDGCLLNDRVAHVHGRQVCWPEPPPSEVAADPPRLAGGGDWRAFRRDLPKLLEQTASQDDVPAVTPETRPVRAGRRGRWRRRSPSA